jgi:lysine-N-methylase
MQTVKTLVGMQYMAGFSCLGGRCEIDCCSEGFNIPYSRGEYENLSKVSSGSEVLKSKVVNGFNMDVPARFFAFVKMNENGFCTFLSSDKLCEIHAALGDGALGNVCRTFPRIINILGDRAELSGALSCPAVARRLFLGANAIQFVHFQREDLPPGLLHYEMEMASENVVLADALRECFIGILSLARYALLPRLFFLATFGEKAGSLDPDEKSECTIVSLRKLFDEITNQTNISKLDHVIQNIRTDASWSLDFMMKLIRDKLKGNSGKGCQKWLERYNSNGNDLHGDPRELFTMCQGAASPELRAHLEHFITMYLCNWVVAKPPEGIRDVRDYLRTLTAFGMLLKFILVTKTAEMFQPGEMSKTHSEQTEARNEIYIKEISAFSRYFEHELRYREKMKQSFLDMNAVSLAHQVMMIKCLA